MSIRVSTLEDGLTVATDRMDTVETVSVGISVDVGTRHERAEINGAAHLLEHMFFKGTGKRTAKDIAEEIEAVGGHLNAYTGREHTTYYAKVLKEDLALAMDILSDILQRSLFDAAELDREREVIVQEIGQAADTPDDIIFDHLQATAFPKQAIGRPVLGSAEVVQRIPRADLVRFKTAGYARERIVVAAAGRLDHEVLTEMVAAKFDSLPAKADVASDPAAYSGGEYREVSDLEQAHVVLALPGVSWTDDDYYAVNVLSTLLGGGMSSRLFQEVREKRGLCYSVYSFSSSFRDGGVFGIYAGTGDQRLGELMPVMLDQLTDLVRGPSEAELARARAQMKSGLLMSLESTGARMETLGAQLQIFGRIIPIAEIVAQVEAVTAADIARVAKRLIAGTPTLAALGPVKKLESVERVKRRLAA